MKADNMPSRKNHSTWKRQLNALASAAIGVPGKARGRGGLSARKDEQRRMARRARCWRVRSVVTQKVDAIEAENFNVHATL
jgi:hypothetical protein